MPENIIILNVILSFSDFRHWNSLSYFHIHFKIINNSWLQMKNSNNKKTPYFNYLKIKHSILGKSDLLFLKSLKIIVLKSLSVTQARIKALTIFFFIWSWTLSLQPYIMWISEKHVAKTKACASVALLWKPALLNLVLGLEAPPTSWFSPCRQLGGKAHWNSPFTLWPGAEHPTLSWLFLPLTVRGI